MKKIHVSLSLAVVLFFACNNPQKNNFTTAENRVPKKPLEKYFYKRLEGSIAGKPVVMELQKTAEISAGNYRYQLQGRNIVLRIDTIIKQDSLVLTEYVLGDPYSEGKDNSIALKWTGTGFKGTFTDKQGKKSEVDLRESYPAGSYRLKPDSLTASLRAFRDKEKPKATIAYRYLVFKGRNEAWVNNNIKSSMSISNGANWKSGLQPQIDSYFEDYKATVKDSESSGAESAAYFLNYESASSLYVKFNEKDFLVLEHMVYSYSGGAHGNYGSGFYNFDIAQQKLLKLKDLVTDTSVLQPLAEAYFRKQQGLSRKDSLNKVLFDNTLELNSNFYLNGQGISFLYNPYEIASYAQGQIEIFIPYLAFKNNLAPWFRKRLGI